MQKKFTMLFLSLGLIINMVACSSNKAPTQARVYFDNTGGDYAYCNAESCPQPTKFTVDNTPAEPPIYLMPESVPVVIQPTVEKITVNFAFSKANLTATDIQRLNSKFNTLKSRKSNIKIKIVGFTDNVEGLDHINAKLANKRALVVKKYLMRHYGYKGNDITTEAKPLCCYVATNKTARGRLENRRSEVQIIISTH